MFPKCEIVILLLSSILFHFISRTNCQEICDGELDSEENAVEVKKAALEYFLERDFEIAIRCFTKLIEGDFFVIVALNFRASSYKLLAQADTTQINGLQGSDEEEDTCDSATSYANSENETMQQGKQHINDGEFHEAIECFTELINSQMDLREALEFRSSAYMSLSEIDWRRRVRIIEQTGNCSGANKRQRMIFS